MQTDRHGTNRKLHEKQICGTNNIFQSKQNLLLQELKMEPDPRRNTMMTTISIVIEVYV